MNFSELEIKSLKKDELERLGELGQLIDVRTDEEYQEGHIRGAKSWPLDQIELFKGDKIKRIIFIAEVEREVHKRVLL